MKCLKIRYEIFNSLPPQKRGLPRRIKAPIERLQKEPSNLVNFTGTIGELHEIIEELMLEHGREYLVRIGQR